MRSARMGRFGVLRLMVVLATAALGHSCVFFQPTNASVQKPQNVAFLAQR
jgi:hypothetical protein